ncbi:MAG TPA: crotonase/enoyl-CoA hydratase family protein [Caulobacteraceae bacterium]|jgi:enoyl-CoA hydratase
MSGLLVEVAEGVAQLKLNRPDAGNAMDAPFWRDFPEEVRRLDARGDVRSLVISGEGRHFSTGMDLSVFMSPEAPSPRGPDPAIAAESFRRLILQLQDTFSCLEQARFPVLAAVQGACVGAGVDLIAACDMRYASANAFFQVQEINLGMVADVGTFPRLCRLIPDGKVRELAYTGRRLRAEAALQLGLVNAVYDTPEALLEGVTAIAREIAGKSPLAVSGSKRMINYAREHATADALDYVATWNAAMFSPEHMAEAFRAQQEKRAAAYRT